MHTTNYFDTFISVAEDCPVSEAEIPPIKGEKRSVANLQYEMLLDHPYEYTSDDVLFTVFALRKEIPGAELEHQRKAYFSKGQPCMRSSPLTKRYGWGIHSNEEGKIAMFPLGSQEYQDLLQNSELSQTRGMRSKRA